MDTLTNKNMKKNVEFINEQMNKKSLANLLAQMYLEWGGAKTAELANNIKNLGYNYATKAGVTISIALMREDISDTLHYFYNYDDAISAYDCGVIKLHEKIVVRDENNKRFETTVGRIIFNETIRKSLLSS